MALWSDPDGHAGNRELAARLMRKGDTQKIAELGLDAYVDMEPLPDWIGYHTTAESMPCPPWEMFDEAEDQPPKWWWRETKMLLESARNEAESVRNQRKR